MPITPTTSSKTTTTVYTPKIINTATSTINNRNRANNQLNCQAPTAIDIVHTISEPGHEIEEISQKISEHAEVIYRTWKSRGLAPTQLLEFYANATTTSTPIEVTSTERKKKPTDAEVISATNDFLANLASTGNTDAITTEGLQQLVNSFVLKDKEQRAVDAMTGKTTTKMATATKTTSSGKPIKSAILLKDEITNPLAPAKVVLKKTIKTTSTPIISTPTITTATATATPMTTTGVVTTRREKTATTTPINSILLKNKIGNSCTLQQQQEQQQEEAPAAQQSAVKLKKSTTKTTTATKIANAATTPTTNVDIHLNRELNLHINDMQHLSQFQNDNLLKITELLQDQSNANKVQNVKNTNSTSNDNKNVKTTITTKYVGSTDEQQPKIKKASRIVVAKHERDNLLGDSVKTSGGGGDDGVDEIDGKKFGNVDTTTTATTTTPKTKTIKLSKLNKNNQAMLINQTDDVTDKKTIANNNNNNNNATVKKIKTKQIKTALTTATTTTTTIPTIATTMSTISSITDTPTTIKIKSIEKNATSSTSKSGAAQSVTTTSASKETNGNSSDVSVISGDSVRTKNRTKIATTNNNNNNNNNKETKEKLIKNNTNNNHKDHKDKDKEIQTDSDKELEDQQKQQKEDQSNINNNNMALVRSNSTSNMPTGSTKPKTARSNSLTNGTEKPVTSRPFLTRGSVAERVMMFEKCPDARNSFLNIKRPDPAEAPPKSLLKVHENIFLRMEIMFYNFFKLEIIQIHSCSYI